MAKLKKVESITKWLEVESTTIYDEKTLFNAIMEMYPAEIEKLSPSASIVSSPVFEATAVKVQRNIISSLAK